MAVDTADKRASVLRSLSPALMTLPFPNSDIDKGDRQQTAGHYRGIPAASPSPLPDRITYQELFDLEPYLCDNMTITINNIGFLWKHNQLIRHSTGVIVYDLIDNVLVKR